MRPALSTVRAQTCSLCARCLDSCHSPLLIHSTHFCTTLHAWETDLWDAPSGFSLDVANERHWQEAGEWDSVSFLPTRQRFGGFCLLPTLSSPVSNPMVTAPVNSVNGSLRTPSGLFLLWLNPVFSSPHHCPHLWKWPSFKNDICFLQNICCFGLPGSPLFWGKLQPTFP